MNIIIDRTWKQGSLVNIEDLRGLTFQAEAQAHTFRISGVDAAGNPITLTGTPSGVMLRPDNTDVALTCAVSDGKVTATLPAECYDVPGRVGITIYLTSNSQKVCIYSAITSVNRTSSGTASPGTTSSVVDLVNAIEAAIAQIPASDTNLKGALAPTYSDSAVYAVGQYAWYDGKLYKCTTAITTSESWTSGHWAEAKLAQDVCDLKSAINAINYSLSIEGSGTRRIISGEIVQGSISLSGITAAQDRISFNKAIPVYPGMKVYFTAGTKINEMYCVKGDENKTQIGNSGWISTDFVCDWTGFIVIRFRSSNGNISPSDFDASVGFASYTYGDVQGVKSSISLLSASVETLNNSAKKTGTIFSNGIINNDDQRIVYSGTWTFDTSGTSKDYKGTNASTSESGAYLEFPFYGNYLDVCVRTASSRGIVEIFVDGVSKGDFDCYQSSVTYSKRIAHITGLSDEPHFAKIVNTGRKNASSSGISFTFDYADYIGYIETKIYNHDYLYPVGGRITSECVETKSQDSYCYYLIKNNGIDKVKVITDGSIGEHAPSIMLFSTDTVNVSGLISATSIQSNDVAEYIAEVPKNCKLILCQVSCTDYIPKEGNSIEVFSKNILQKPESNKINMILLDCGRKYFKVANIKAMIDCIKYTGCSALQLFFSGDQGFRFGLDDMTISANGTTYDLSTALGDGITIVSGGVTKAPDGTDKWLTESEMTEIIQYANKNGIEIVPGFDMPSHLGAILDKFPQFKYENDNVDIDIYNENAVNFILAICKKYASFFAANGCKYYNFGGDELKYLPYLLSHDELHYYDDVIESLSRIVMSEGMIPMAFNEAIYYGGIVNRNTNTNIISLYWDYQSNYPSVNIQASMGIKLINTNEDFYYVLGVNHKSLTGMISIDTDKFADNQYFFNSIGNCFCIWCDKADTDGADEGDALTTAVIPYINAFGVSVKEKKDYGLE